jgi:hypothetical protein
MGSSTGTPNLLGLRTAIYHVPNVAQAKAGYSKTSRHRALLRSCVLRRLQRRRLRTRSGYRPFLVPTRGGVVAYWGVADVDAGLKRLLSLGAIERTNVQDVGEGIRVATVFDPFRNVFGVIETPHFKLPTAFTE